MEWCWLTSAVALDYSVEFLLAAGIHDHKLNADAKVYLSTDLTEWAVQDTKKLNDFVTDKILLLFLFPLMMLLWPDPALTHINSRAFCQLCYEQRFWLLQWNGLGAGWPWIARLPGKGYFLPSGGVILAYKMWLKRVKPTLLRISHFLRGREHERQTKHTC